MNSGSQQTIRLTPGYAGFAYPEYWSVFIDWNKDGVLDPFAEEAAYGYGIGTITRTIHVPHHVTAGDVLMRVVMDYNGWPATCALGFSGEAEDYTISIGESLNLQIDGINTAVANTTHTEIVV